MRAHILTLVIICLFSIPAFAQNTYGVKGVIADSVEHIKLGNTSIAILDAKDSILVKYTRSAADGSFAVTGLSKGKFIVLVAYPDYADYVEPFSIDSVSQVHNFGHINMNLKSRLLKEVIIKGTAAQMKIKGDTTEFNARAFVTQPNAKVEDLLKQLPGIQVDKDGKITAQGEVVKKVLVDGEEFFGDDPTLVTKNIRADMVDKVQLYDKKSDQAAFTGIDDGKKEKTLNIKLKEDKKNGMFGKAQAGDGSGNIYQGELLFNAFKAKKKFSVYGTMANNSRVGLGWEDNQKYGSGGGFEFDDSGSGAIFIGGGNADDLDSFGGQYNGQGLPVARNAGVHFDNKWKDDKQSINANFKIGSLTIDGTSDNLTQNNQQGSILNTNSDQAYHNYMERQKLDLVYQVKLDTASNLKISADGTLKHSTTRSNYTSHATTLDTLTNGNIVNAPVNDNTRDLNNNVDQRAFNASAFYTHKFKKPGRTWSLRFNEAYSQNKANGLLQQDILYYDGTTPPQHVDEKKTNNLQSQAVSTNLTYSEPFSKFFSVILNYAIGIDNNSADRRTYNPSSPNQYNILVDSLSNNYHLNQLSNQVGAIFNYKRGKSVLNFGTRTSYVRFQQIDEYTSEATSRSFINWTPQARYEYRFSQQKAFGANYNGNTSQPTLDQIQPIKNNNDYLNVIIGNPTLTPSFTSNFSLFYRSYKVIGDQFFYISGNYSFTTNPIVADINTDISKGSSTTEYFNLKSKQPSNFSMYGNFGRKIESLGNLSVGINWSANGNTYYNYSNDVLNRTKSYTFNPGLNLSRFKEKVIEFYVSGGPTYTISESSLQPNVNNNGWGANASGQLVLYLPGKFQIGSYSDYIYTAKTQSFNQDFSRALINAFIIKTFLKENNLKMEIWGNDLFNQNKGFSRTANGNLIMQNTYTTLKRYFMFTVTYDFTRMGGGAPKK